MACWMTNKWWEGGPKEGTKGFFKRLTFALFKVVMTVKEYTVLLALLLGIACIFLVAWLRVTADTQERKANEPLIGFDNFIDEVIDNLNFLTQDLPNDVIKFTNDTLYKMEDVANGALGTCINSLNGMMDKLGSATQDTTLKVMKWGCDQMPSKPSGCSKTFSIPKDPIPFVQIPSGWEPSLNPVDLSSIRIPDRDFSAYKELSPFVHQVYNIPRQTADYIESAGIILLTYAGIRIFFAFISPFLPCPDFYCCCGMTFSKVVKVSSEGVLGFLRMLAKPWIHVPLVFGICLILLVVLWLNPSIDKLGEDIKKPLHSADIATADFINKVNHLIEQISVQVIDWMNALEKRAYNSITEQLGNALDDIYAGANQFIVHDIQDPINEFLKQLDSGIVPIFIQPFGVESPLVVYPPQYLPPIPYLPTDLMMIPVDLLGIEKPVSPWVDDRIQELHDIANSILQVGIWCVVIPGIALLWGFFKPFIPRKVNEFFTEPDFYSPATKSSTQQNRPLP